MKFVVDDGVLMISTSRFATGVRILNHLHDTIRVEDHRYLEIVASLQRGETLIPWNKKSDKYVLFATSATLGREWIQPYLNRMALIHGDIPEFPALDLSPGDDAVNCLRVITSATLDPVEFTLRVDGYVVSQDWNGKTARERAPASFLRYLQEDIGELPLISEFIETGCGVYKRNPAYGKDHPPRPAPTSKWLWDSMFGYWRENHASPGQIRLLQEHDDYMEKCRFRDHDYDLSFTTGLTLGREELYTIPWTAFQKVCDDVSTEHLWNL